MLAKSGRVVSPSFSELQSRSPISPKVNKINIQAETFVFKNSVVFTVSYNNIRISLENN